MSMHSIWCRLTGRKPATKWFAFRKFNPNHSPSTGQFSSGGGGGGGGGGGASGGGGAGGGGGGGGTSYTVRDPSTGQRAPRAGGATEYHRDLDAYASPTRISSQNAPANVRDMPLPKGWEPTPGQRAWSSDTRPDGTFSQEVNFRGPNGMKAKFSVEQGHGTGDEVHGMFRVYDGAGKVVGRNAGPQGDLPRGHEAVQSFGRSLHENTPSAVGKSVEWQVPIFKADPERRLVYGVVLQPDIVDSQDDRVSAEEIEKACHDWMRGYHARRTAMGLQHERKAPAVEPVECYLSPDDCQIGGQDVKKGSWVLVSYVGDDRTWESVKQGAYSGYSIGGTAERSE